MPVGNSVALEGNRPGRLWANSGGRHWRLEGQPHPPEWSTRVHCRPQDPRLRLGGHHLRWGGRFRLIRGSYCCCCHRSYDDYTRGLLSCHNLRACGILPSLLPRRCHCYLELPLRPLVQICSSPGPLFPSSSSSPSLPPLALACSCLCSSSCPTSLPPDPPAVPGRCSWSGSDVVAAEGR